MKNISAKASYIALLQGMPAYSDAKLQQLDLLLTELAQAPHNVTAIRDPDQVWVKHFLDSLSLSCFYPFREGIKVLDIGSGAGFPGLPLAIFYPETQLVLLESIAKKAEFCSFMAARLGLTNVTVLNQRAEDLGGAPGYDLVVSRAVAHLATLLEYALPVLPVGGQFWAYKQDAGEIPDSIYACELLGGSNPVVQEYQLPGVDVGRYFVSVTKERSSPPGYPRRTGMPSKRPLLAPRAHPGGKV